MSVLQSEARRSREEELFPTVSRDFQKSSGLNFWQFQSLMLFFFLMNFSSVRLMQGNLKLTTVW
jgi:hypothetical protein